MRILLVDRRWQAIRDLVTRGSLILDAGCGTGSWTHFLSARGYKVVALDYSSMLVGQATTNASKAHSLVGEVTRLPLQGKSVDAIVSWGVIEHDERGLGPALDEFRRVLRADGHIFVTVPRDSSAVRNAFSFEREESTKRYERDRVGRKPKLEFYQYLLTEDDLAHHLESSGFRVESVRPISRHLAVASPRLAAHVERLPYPISNVIGRVLLSLAFPRDTYLMIMGVARAR